ncbi:MAG: peptidoglycan-binding domain-containing protein [Alphaproteobacteria bacterium]
MRKPILAATLTVMAAAAQAGEPMSPGQEIQAIQSGLTILGYDPGPVDGLMGARTRAAIAAFERDTGFVESDAVPEGLLINAVLDATGPALAERFGLDPTGSWDLDREASGYGAAEPGQETCAGGGHWYFSGGIVWRDFDSGSPLVLALNGDRLETVPLPSGEFIEANAFVVVDDRTMHRLVEGETEVWVLCDDWGADDGTPDAPAEDTPAQ